MSDSPDTPRAEAFAYNTLEGLRDMLTVALQFYKEGRKEKADWLIDEYLKMCAAKK